MTVAEDTYLLGSGDLYLGVVTNPSTATEEEIQAALKNVGAISGGAALAYKPTFYEIESANRGTIASFKTKEEVTFKSGILTWDLKNLESLSSAYYSETSGSRRVGIGGLKNVPVNYVRFVHIKPDGLKLTVNLFKAQAQSGFELTFDKEKETVIDAEFKALAVVNKNDGNLVEIIEEIGVQPLPTVNSLSVTSLSTAELPYMIKVTGTNFKQDSIVIAEQFDGEHELKTLYDSSTGLYAELDGLTASTYSIKVKNGSQISTVYQSLTITSP
ncbi:IPT/TIG domain-containing protein [Mesobacillus sp. S13]|uniref:IPT/TIG domain-containing protein n=1 Tax=Mesobacillus sp. S13 TaxID=2880221 RepID=UPI001CF11367|nr:IPT/TIG domain-containing protein [Mesobacillus sp. S13]